MARAAGQWFEGRSLGDRVTLIRETHVHPFARCNLWHVRGRDRDLPVDQCLTGRRRPGCPLE